MGVLTSQINSSTTTMFSVYQGSTRKPFLHFIDIPVINVYIFHTEKELYPISHYDF